MWTCACKTQNNTSSPFCTNCKSVMPSSERKRIYNEQLLMAQKALGIDYIGDIEKAAQELLGDKTITVDKISSAIFRIPQIILMWFFKHKIIIISVLLFITFFSSFTSLFSSESKYIRNQTRIENIINRRVITENISSKLKSIPDRTKYYFDNPANSINDEVRQEFKEKFAAVNQGIDKVKQNVNNLIQDGLIKLEKILEECINKIKEMKK
ncbi:MAG: hypothetical protein E7404_05560 [Ruminococcaceae bacterium]|nr:hypothetical protein [Oscillospiraceae bacterium]